MKMCIMIIKFNFMIGMHCITTIKINLMIIKTNFMIVIRRIMIMKFNLLLVISVSLFCKDLSFFCF